VTKAKPKAQLSQFLYTSNLLAGAPLRGSNSRHRRNKKKKLDSRARPAEGEKQKKKNLGKSEQNGLWTGDL
jgi:hypothetical protein